jgi:hypothetical protein
MIGIRLRVHSTCQDVAGAWIAGPTHAVVRCKLNSTSPLPLPLHLQIMQCAHQAPLPGPSPTPCCEEPSTQLAREWPGMTKASALPLCIHACTLDSR